MALKKLLLVLAGFAGISAFAQTSPGASAAAQNALGTATSVNGVVTATQGATGMSVGNGTLIQNGMRFVTTSSGSVTLNLRNNCTITVPPNHALTVLQSLTCDQLRLAMRPVAGSLAQGPNFPPAPGLVQAAIVGGGIGIAAASIKQVVDDNDEPLSAR